MALCLKILEVGLGFLNFLFSVLTHADAHSKENKGANEAHSDHNSENKGKVGAEKPRLRSVDGNADLELLRVGGIVGHIEVLHEALTEDPVVHVVAHLLDDTQMADRHVGLVVDVVVEEGLRGHAVSLVLSVCQSESEDKVRHCISDFSTWSDKPAPISA